MTPSRGETRRSRRRTWIGGLSVAALIGGVLIGLPPTVTQAQTVNVACQTSSLISALAAASSGTTTLVLPSGCTYALTSVNNSSDGGTGLPVITANVTIQGNGATLTRSTTSGTPAFRLLDVASGGSLTISSLTLNNGLANGGQQGGGAIFSHGTLTVSASTFTNNSSPSTTGTSGGAINSSGTLNVTTSLFTGNSAQEGGGVFNQSLAAITDSTFSGNNATIYGGGALLNAAGSETAVGDTFVSNTGPGGGAIDNDTSLSISDSTFNGNTGGGNGGGAVENFGHTTITRSTLDANTSPYGADILNYSGYTLTISQSIVGDGLGGANCDASAPISDGGYNIDTGSSCGFSTSNDSLPNTAPDLDALASNGGPTQTMALAAGSPALDVIPPSVTGCSGGTDQRGIARPQGSGCDVGAYELVVTSTDTQPPTVPTGLTATTVTSNSVGLSWSASTDPDGIVVGYTVYRNGVAVGSTGGATTYTDLGVYPGTTYQYTVDAVDGGGNHSAQSTALPVTTPPSAPTGLATTSETASSVGLSWSPSTGGATGYTVYRNGTAVGTTATTSYTDSTVSPSTTYQYTVDAFDAGGGRSAQSGALSVTTSAGVTTPTRIPPHGYWLVGSDGGIFSFGSALFHGSMGGTPLQRPVVGIVATANRGGYWLDASDGGVFSFGDTQFYGSIPGLGLHPAGSGLAHSLNAPIVGMVASHDQGGYFMVASDGGVFAFGDAKFAGSCPSIGGCAGAAVAVIPDASGNGYWLITSTGNVYAFGDAPYFGAPGRGNVTSAVSTPGGKGYWILLSDGEVFGYGDAANLGSPSSANFSDPNAATAIFATSDGGGYWVSSALGEVFSYGDAPSDGGMSATHLNGSIIAATGY